MVERMNSSPVPRTGLGRVLDDLGGTLLGVVHGRSQTDAGSTAIGGVAIHDPLDDIQLPDRAIVLGVGVDGPAAVVRLLRAVGKQGAVGLVLRAPVEVTDEVAAAADETHVVLLGLAPGATWTQLAAMLRTLLAEDDIGTAEPESLGGFASGDLFALANAIASLLDAPITIEDRGSRVLAFSGRQDEADAGRALTILGRQVPEPYLRQLVDRGVFRELHRRDEPIYIDPVITGPGEMSQPRIAVAVRAGDETLGSIWAAVTGPLDDDRLHALRDSAKLVALHMLRARAGADVERRLRTDLLATALEGRSGGPDAMRRLGLANQPVVVLALSVVRPDQLASVDGIASLAAERQRLADAFSLHLAACHPRSAAALIADTTYGLMPVVPDRPGAVGLAPGRAVAIGTEFLDRLGGHTRAVIGVGPVADDIVALPRSRATADRVVRTLREGVRRRRVATLADVHVESLLVELRDLAHTRGDHATGPVARLLEYDDDHGAQLIRTLRAWLDCFGDVIAAAESVHVHPNTFRYRLRRLSQVGDIDLTDPEARLGAMLQLRVLVPRPSVSTAPSERTSTDRADALRSGPGSDEAPVAARHIPAPAGCDAMNPLAEETGRADR